MEDKPEPKNAPHLKIVKAIRHCPAAVVQFDDILKEEHDWIRTRRKESKVSPGNPAEDAVGLSLSGGGIRSATFCLGLLQSLQRYGLLKHVDYMSTVSGGGYIGASLTWFKSEYKDFPFGERRKDHDKHPGAVLKWLRTHGSYLSPGSGLTGWAVGGAVAMGMIVNALVILPILAFMFYAASRFVPLDFQTLGGEPTTLLGLVFYAGLIVLAVFVANTLAIACVPTILENPRHERWIRTQLGRVLKIGALLTLFGLIPFVDFWLSSRISAWIPSFASLAGGALAVLRSRKGGTAENENSRGRSSLLGIGLLLLLYGMCLGGYHVFRGLDSEIPWFAATPTLGWLVVFALIGLVLALYSDINMVSMHRFYRDRLRTAFIDLPEPPAKPEAAQKTEEDEKADKERRERRLLCELRRTDAPYPLINTIIQTVGSSEPKLRGRGGDNFLFSPLFCGSESTGYRSTKTYMKGKMDLATAMAISGAAVDPNTYMTRKTGVRVLMTLLNMRLGYWITNPRFESPGWMTRPFWLRYVMREARGCLDETSKEIHLSDGGGFENLGIYELIRRRCKVIFACDASGDSLSAFSDLGKVIEMVRADFGVKIQILVDELITDPTLRRANASFTVGKIVYDEDEADTCGYLVYMNTTLTKGLMADLHSYARMNAVFPEESTVDQFFDERQFEAYRELGYQIGKKLCQEKEWASPAALVEALYPDSGRASVTV